MRHERFCAARRAGLWLALDPEAPPTVMGLVVVVGLLVLCFGGCATAAGPIMETPVVKPIPDLEHGVMCYIVRDENGRTYLLSCSPAEVVNR